MRDLRGVRNSPASSNGNEAPGWPGSGVVTLECSVDIDGLIRALLTLLDTAGLDVLAVIDHSGDAAEVGLTMPDTKLVLFGNAVAGTPLMVENPLLALDLPPKLLLWTDRAGRVFVSYNDGDWVADRYQLPESRRAVLRRTAGLAAKLARRGTSSER